MREGVFLFPVAMVLIFAGIPIVWSMIQAGRRRELEHIERMRSIEMGLTPPGENRWPAAVCIAIGAVVPIGALLIGVIASFNAPRQALSASPDAINVYLGCVWGAVIPISLLSVVGGSLLSWFLLGLPNHARTAARKPSLFDMDKPTFDPDAYDTVGSRG